MQISIFSHNNTISRDVIRDNYDAIDLFGDDNEIFKNSILNTNGGIKKDPNSERNQIYYNDLVENRLPVQDDSTNNKWLDKVRGTFFGNY